MLLGCPTSLLGSPRPKFSALKGNLVFSRDSVLLDSNILTDALPSTCLNLTSSSVLYSQLIKAVNSTALLVLQHSVTEETFLGGC